MATAYIPNICNIYIPIYSSILRFRYVVAMNSYRIKIVLKYLCGYYENNENILQYTTVYSQNIIIQQPGPMARRVISWLIFCIFFCFRATENYYIFPSKNHCIIFLQYFLSFRTDSMEHGPQFCWMEYKLILHPTQIR